MNEWELYHRKQYETPMRSTVAFLAFLERHTDISTDSILDFGCGGGANDCFIASAYPKSKVTGVDIDDSMFFLLEEYAEKGEQVKLEKGDFCRFQEGWLGKFDGVISLQTISWIPRWEPALENMVRINPRWIAISSLFYEGKIEYEVKLRNYERPLREKIGG